MSEVRARGPNYTKHVAALVVVLLTMTDSILCGARSSYYLVWRRLLHWPHLPRQKSCGVRALLSRKAAAACGTTCSRGTGWRNRQLTIFNSPTTPRPSALLALMPLHIQPSRRLQLIFCVTLTVLLLVVLLPVILSTFAAGRDAYDGASEQLTDWHEEVFGNGTRGS